MPAVDDRCQVDVDDVAVFQFVLVGNSVADDFVHTDATDVGVWWRARRPCITQAGWRVTVVERVFLKHSVEVDCPNTGLGMWTDKVHQFGVKATRGSQELSFFSVVNWWLPAQQKTPVFDDSKKLAGSAQLPWAISPMTRESKICGPL